MWLTRSAYARLGTVLICSSMLLLLSFDSHAPQGKLLPGLLITYKQAASRLGRSSLVLEGSINLLNPHRPSSLLQAKDALKKCRLDYKRIEFFLEYFFRSSSFIFNRPPKYEIEEPSLEFSQPQGFQTIEALLFSDSPYEKKNEILAQAKVLSTSTQNLGALTYRFEASDKEILESIQIELIRVMALSITGYDAPQLKSGLSESEQTLLTMNELIGPLVKENKNGSDQICQEFEKAISLLRANPDFDSFDRLTFLKNALLPLQHQLRVFVKKSGLYMNTVPALNYDSKNLFSANAFQMAAFSDDTVMESKKLNLGKKLFFSSILSSNNKISCASCHMPEYYFSDRLSKSLAIDGHSHISRNAPSLLYAGFQHAQFWDGRAKTLEEQIEMVIHNPQELNSTDHELLQKLSESFRSEFYSVFKSEKDSKVSMTHLSSCLSTYVRSLKPFNSDFDRYLNGSGRPLTKREIHGFNLFTGKAQCATCHFMPLFNGLTPPYYAVSEYEIIGVPQTENLLKPIADTDQGRAALYNIQYYKKAFKTPGIRDCAKTAPFMHNGSLTTLEKVLEFYNKGGGIGIGLGDSNQTLSSQPLHLSKTDIGDIIGFMNTLSDHLVKDNAAFLPAKKRKRLSLLMR